MYNLLKGSQIPRSSSRLRSLLRAVDNRASLRFVSQYGQQRTAHEESKSAPESSHLHKTIEGILKDREARSARRRLTVAAQDAVDFSSNDFLSLTKSNELRSEYFAELSGATHMPLGSGSSRLLDGNSIYAEDIEKELASFYGAPAGLLFNSGYDANSGFFSCVPQPSDVIVYDEYIHASVHEGMRLSRAKDRRSFRHNSPEDFRQVLLSLAAEDDAFLQGKRNVIVAVESVYSMDGDVAPIQQLLDVIDSVLPNSNGHLVVDEAHSTGVYGPLGRGIVCDVGAEHRLLARLHTFGKALSSGGAIILCHPTLREYLINYARSLIYTTAMGLPTLATIKTVHTFMKEGRTEAAQRRLWQLVQYFQDRIETLPQTPLLTIPSGPPKSPIFSLCTPDPRSLAGSCQQAGLIVRAIMPPTVPKGGQRVRVCLHTDNTELEIDRLIDVIASWLQREAAEMRDQSAMTAKQSSM